MKLSQYAKQEGIRYKSAYARYKKGRIPGAYKDQSGHIVVPQPKPTHHNKAAVYARVSTPKQKEDLDRQAKRLVEFANAQGLEVVSITKEVASGVNDTRPKLTKLLESDGWGVLVVEHKDRLSRVGYNWFEVLLNKQGRAIKVANRAEEEKADLLEDFVAIIYSFAARLYGLRAAQNKAKLVREVLEK